MRCTSVFDANGRFNPTYDPKITRKVDTKSVLLAIGLSALRTRNWSGLGFWSGDGSRRTSRPCEPATPRCLPPATGLSGLRPSSTPSITAIGPRITSMRFSKGRKIRSLIVFPGAPAGSPLSRTRAGRHLAARSRFPVRCDSLTAECETTYDWDMARRQAVRCLRCDTETGMSDYSRRTREHIHAMARTAPDDFPRLREILTARLKPRNNPFPPERPAQLDDLVFLPAALTRLVIDPYREHCSTATPDRQLAHPQTAIYFYGIRRGARTRSGKPWLRHSGSVGLRLPGLSRPGGWRERRFRPNGRVPWLQLIVPGRDEPQDGGGRAGVRNGRPIPTHRRRKGPEGSARWAFGRAAALPEAIPYALENGFDLLVLDGTPGVELPWAELAGVPDLTVIRDALRGPSGSSIVKRKSTCSTSADFAPAQT